VRYYHGTSSRLEDVIKEEGLVPSQRWEYVFLDSSARVASSHSYNALDRVGGKPILVVVESSRVPEALIVKESECDLWATWIPPEAIVGFKHLKKDWFKRDEDLFVD